MASKDNNFRRKIAKHYRPILKGFLNEKSGSVHVWCPFCAKYHNHGIGASSSEAGKAAIIGHRQAHCIDENSPLHETGYYIILCTKKELEALLGKKVVLD